jgi:hypothetical protein
MVQKVLGYSVKFLEQILKCKYTCLYLTVHIHTKRETFEGEGDKLSVCLSTYLPTYLFMVDLMLFSNE